MGRKRSDDASAPDVVESRADKFRRLGNRRLPNAIKAIRYLANLGNTRQYDYTPQQRDIVLSEVNKAVKHLFDAFADVQPTENGTALFF